MRFLVDAQLPPALARFLETNGHDADHVSELELESDPDQRIWQVALERNATIITKDEDFIRLRALAATGPAIVWVRIGNTTRDELIRRFSASFAQIRQALESGEPVVELSGD